MNNRLEVDLILHCARTYIDSTTAEHIIRLLRKDIDWAYLIPVAFRHGVAPLLYQSLNTTYPEAVPKAILSQMRDFFHANAQRNLFLTLELINVLNLFDTHKIPVLPFKGLPLAALVYGNIALRQFSDLDILVHKQNFLKAKNLLMSQGYRVRLPLTDAKEYVYIQFQSELEFFHDDLRIMVDMHWGILPRRFSSFFTSEYLWEGLEQISLAGKVIQTFSLENWLLILCMNGSKERWQRLGRICDIAELLRVRQEMNWEWIMMQSETLGTQRSLCIGLFLANQLLNTAIPKKVWQRIQDDSTVKFLTAIIKKQIFCNSDDSSDIFKKFRFHLSSRERLREKGQYIFLSAIYYSLRPWLGVLH